MSTRGAAHARADEQPITFEYLGHPGHVATATPRRDGNTYGVRCSCGIEVTLSRSELNGLRPSTRRRGSAHA